MLQKVRKWWPIGAHQDHQRLASPQGEHTQAKRATQRTGRLRRHRTQKTQACLDHPWYQAKRDKKGHRTTEKERERGDPDVQGDTIRGRWWPTRTTQVICVSWAQQQQRISPPPTDEGEGNRPTNIIHTCPRNSPKEQKQTLSPKGVNSYGDNNSLGHLIGN